MEISTTSARNTPQAKHDTFLREEDDFSTGSTVLLDVMANDGGGKAKVLWSVEDDYGDALDPAEIQGFLKKDSNALSDFSTWNTTTFGNQVGIVGGKLYYHVTAEGAAAIQALGDGEVIHDTFSYAIRLANGTLSIAKATVTITGAHEAAPNQAPVNVIPIPDAGTLDTSFGGGDGKVTTAVGPSWDYAAALAVQSDGGILVAGSTRNGGEFSFALVRYNPDGTLDTGFGGGDGIVTTEIGGPSDFAYALAVQADGKIVLAGSAWNGSDNDLALVRYNADGTLDTGFGGGDGVITTPVGASEDVAQALAVQADGKIVLAGSASNGSDGDFALVRYNADGTLDTGFGGGDGKVTTAIGASHDTVTSMAVQADGKILVAGSTRNGSDSDFALVRYNADGTLDTGFGGGDGIVTTAVGPSVDFANALAVQADGKIVLVGSANNGSDNDFALVRYNPDGTLDTGFGSGGMLLIDFADLGVSDDLANGDRASGVAIAADGTIVVSGSVGDDFAVVRVHSGALAAREDTPTPITGLRISDPDAGTGMLTVTLSVQHGTLAVSGGSAGIAGNGTSSVTLTGTVGDINATLAATVSYQPVADYHGADTLTMVTNDHGNTGTGGPLSDTDVIPISVAPMDDASLTGDDGWALSVAGTTAAGVTTATESTHNDTDAQVTAVSGLPAGLTASFDGAGHLVDNTIPTPAPMGTDTALASQSVLDTASRDDSILRGDHDVSDLDLLTDDLVLTANHAQDTFFRSHNNDTSSGTAGADTLTGDDTFRWDGLAHLGDTLLDFLSTDDTLRFDVGGIGPRIPIGNNGTTATFSDSTDTNIAGNETVVQFNDVLYGGDAGTDPNADAQAALDSYLNSATAAPFDVGDTAQVGYLGVAGNAALLASLGNNASTTGPAPFSNDFSLV